MRAQSRASVPSRGPNESGYTEQRARTIQPGPWSFEPQLWGNLLPEGESSLLVQQLCAACVCERRKARSSIRVEANRAEALRFVTYLADRWSKPFPPR